MNRITVAAALGLLAAGVAVADIPPPKGLRRIPIEYKLEATAEFPDYAFFAVSGGDKAEPVKLDPKAPATVRAGGGRYRTAQLVAVPKGAAKAYPGEKEFLAAVAAGKVDGAVKAKEYFQAFTTVKDADPRAVIVERYTVEKVGPGGITLAPVKEPGGAKPDGGEEAAGADEDAHAVPAPRYGRLAAGVSVSLAVVLAGLLIARRARSGR